MAKRVQKAEKAVEKQTVRVAVLDTETTGLSSSWDRIIEIAIILVEADRTTGRIVTRHDSYQGLQDPGIRIPPMATSIHGITNAMVKGKRIEVSAVKTLLVQADLLVAHNTGFDKGFVAQVIPEADEMTWGCSCRGIPWKKMFPGIYSTSLQTLVQNFRLPKHEAHRALGDAETTLALLEVPLPEVGVTALGHLIKKKVR